MTALQRVAPRRAKSQLRITELLRAAREVFSEHGFQHATTALIAERAGVSEATVFTYFAGKRELCIQVIKDWYDEISTEVEPEMPHLQGVYARLSLVNRHLAVTLLADGSGMCALVLGEGRATGPDLADVITECKRRYTAPLMDCLAQGQKQGEIRTDVPLRLMRELIYGSMEHVLWDSITNQKRPAIDKTAEQLTALIWSAITPPNASLEALTRFRDEVRQALQQSLQVAPPSGNDTP